RGHGISISNDFPMTSTITPDAVRRRLTSKMRAMETRTSSLGDVLAHFRNNNSKGAQLRRRSTRRRISNAQRLADLENFINKRVQASDGFFFEKITGTNERDVVKAPEQDELYTIKNLSLNGSRKELEALYVEALYTITHKVGKEDCASQENLFKYVRSAFKGDQTLHNNLLLKAKNVKPPVVLLNVLLLEGRDLVAKDVNGFSDPFAMMGVVPGKKLLSVDSPVQSKPDSPSSKSPVSPEIRTPDDDGKKKEKEGVLHRFGGSFRRKINVKDKKGKNATAAEQIPAKLIKASSVMKKTLNPTWNEKFQLLVEDISSDKFHIDIWDHDDESQCVVDAVSSLNQIKGGLKGIGRYFKEVAQSARADSDESTDDFLGCLDISLNNIPTQGVEEWFDLRPRSEKSKVKGQVKLKLWLSTREERFGADADDDLLDVKEHIELMRQFALYEIHDSGQPVRMWDGVYPDVALTILRQHAVQGDITDAQSAMCKWMALASMVNIDISFSLLFATLQNLLSKWAPMALDKEEENMLSESVSSFDNYCKRCLIEHRTRFAPSRRNSGEEFEYLLKCMKILRESEFYQKILPFKRPFNAHVEAFLSKSAEEYFVQVVEQYQDDDPCKELLKILVVINGTCSRFLHYSAPIKNIIRADYSQITLSTFDRMLTEYLTSELMSEKKADLRTQMRLSAAQDPPDEDGLIDLICIHIAFIELRNHKLANRVRGKDETEWNIIFDRGIKKLFEVAKVKADARMTLSCQLDVPIAANEKDMRHSSSHIDVCHIVEQMTVCWERIEPSELMLKIEYSSKLVDLLCTIVTSYAAKVLAQLEAEGFAGDLQVFIPTTLLGMLCSAINNCEQVRRSLMINEKLHLDDLATQYSKEGKGRPVWKEELERRLESCDSEICAHIEKVVNQLTKRLHAQIKKHIFHLAWSPAACPVEDAIKPLTDMLDVELSAVHRVLLHKNFLRVMSAQMAIILQLLRECVDENPGLDPAFYRRLLEAVGVLTDFFHAGGKGISMDVLETNPNHVTLVKILTTYQTPTEQLIERYYKGLLKQQNDAHECKYGILNLRAYYNQNTQTLVVEVLGAKQVIPLDTNGLSDPFVIVELVPKFRYPNQQSFKTKVVSKTLNPVFDESFEFLIPPVLPPAAMLHFTVMDYDYLRSNDFAGEAFLELAEVPGFGTAGVSPNALRQFNLLLIQPVEDNKELIETLRSRVEDKQAIE
ncbi:hypothetical protein PMAYCL1PPCAC_30943, partial [Pristionchus mayeri]